MHFLAEYGLFLIKTITWVIAILVVVIGIVAIIGKSKLKDKEKGQLVIKKLNDYYQQVTELGKQHICNKKQLKQFKKQQKKQSKQTEEKNNLFVINFHGDMHAHAVSALREEITAILLSANENDEVLVRLESPGGVVPAYGLASSQLQRIRDARLKLTIAVDKVAASGGYMMACIANHIIAAPFAIIGSVGVVAQLPNFHKFLGKKDIDFEQFTAGEYKRTVTIFGKNTDQGRKKLQQEIDETHQLFKAHIKQHRVNIDIDKIATGEYWYGTQALPLQLIDKLQTSDDYLLNKKKHYQIFEVQYKIKKSLSKRFSIGIYNLLTQIGLLK